jgi:hypothetical protein
VAPISRKFPADCVFRTGTMSSDGRVASPRASSSLGPDDTSARKASVPGTGLVCWLAGGGVRVARERPMGDPAGGGASHVPLEGGEFEAGSAEKGSEPGGAESWLEPGWETAGLRGCGATRGGPKPGAAAADGTETGGGVAAGRSTRDMFMAGGKGAAGPRPVAAGICDEARGGPAAGLMTVTAPMTCS